MSRLGEWDRVAELFDELCELGVDERERRLEELAVEPELAAELRRMLDADRASDPRFEEGVGAFLGSTSADSLDQRLSGEAEDESAPDAGARIGPWRLERLLGRGGMGEVWEAVRTDGDFQQTVAVKLLRRGLDTEDVRARFLRERRLLARLEHPRIARLFDGGATPDGRPWFAMERVEGRPITAYCDERALDLTSRLRLFLDVCEAVEYAHRSLVIHRDLKPSNVLVSDDGEVKLLDFGIAKVVEGDEQEASATRAEFRALTPSHAAPEQILGEVATTATDVYALGVMLYELLTGRTPHRRESITPQGLLEAIHREMIARPSSAVRQPDGRPPVGMVDPARLARLLTGDLDVIALKALARDPERRYPTVAALAEDLRRHLEGLPILARPDAIGYRAHKFLGRHRAGVAAAVASLVVLLATTGWYAVSVAGERDRARAAAARAEAQFARAEAARDFLVRLIQDADPMGSGGQRTVSELLRSAPERVEKELAEQPELQAEMGVAVAGALRGVGDGKSALALAERSIERLRRLGATDSRVFAVGLSQLGQLRIEAGDLQRAQAAIREAVTVMESLPPSIEIDSSLISARTGLAKALGRSGHEREAQDVRKEILASRIRLLGDAGHPDLAVDWYNLGVGYQALDQFAEAESAIRNAGRLLVAAHGESHPRLINVWLALCLSLAMRGDFVAAEEYERKAERLLTGEYADLHPLRGSLHMIRARRLLFAGDGDAAAAAQEAVHIFRRGENVDLSRALSQLGASLLVSRRYAAAAEAFDESWSIKSVLRGPGDARTRLQQVGRDLAHWQLSGDEATLEDAIATLATMQWEGQDETREFADGSAWLSAALEQEDPTRAAQWRAHAERSLASLYPAEHPWRTSLAGTRRP